MSTNIDKERNKRPPYSIPEFATGLNVKPATVRAWLMQRKVAKIKLGRRVLIPATELDRLLNENLIPALPERGAQ